MNARAELRRPILLDHIGPSGLDFAVEASPAECAALARRMQLPAIHALTCQFRLSRGERDHIVATARLRVRITQTCIVTAEDFETDVDEAFRIRFIPAGEETEVIDPEADDDFPYHGNSIDLGEATAEQLGLAIDPYPRMPGAELPDAEDHDVSASSLFAGLGSLRKPH